ncbi:TPA: hypothetical protein RUZ25_002327 [Vibrio cholerae]|nr:hypothetical protein [Vibrio cholerae]
MENSFAITTTFIVYLILMLAIGVYAYQRTKNSADYFLGGRSLGPWPAALSAGASDMSGWLLLGLPGYAYAAGIESFWLAGGLLMAAALMIVPIAAMNGGFTQLNHDLAAINPELLTLWNDAKGEPLSAIAIISLVAWGLGYFGQPHILARFKASRSNKDLTTARRIAVVWTGLSMAGAILVGLTGLIFVTQSGTIGLDDGEKIFMLLVNSLFHPVIAGILLAAILAAIMSTADSQLLVSSSALAEDFYKQVFKTDASSEDIVRVGRIAVILISLIALFLAMTPDSSVLGLVSYAWAGFGAAFGPALVLSLYWPRMNRHGALSGIIVGGVTIVVWKQLSGGWFDVYEIVPGIILSTLSIVVVSLLTGEPDEKVKAQHATFKKQLIELE